jgi:hypothetical protein
MLPQATLGADDLQAAGATLKRLERFWIRAADLVQRTPPQFAAPRVPEVSQTAMSSAR